MNPARKCERETQPNAWIWTWLPLVFMYCLLICGKGAGAIAWLGNRLQGVVRMCHRNAGLELVVTLLPIVAAVFFFLLMGCQLRRRWSRLNRLLDADRPDAPAYVVPGLGWLGLVATLIGVGLFAALAWALREDGALLAWVGAVILSGEVALALYLGLMVLTQKLCRKYGHG